MKKLLLGSFVAGIALFFWGFIYYGLSGIPYQTLATPADTAPSALKANFPAHGTYIIPSPTAVEMPDLQVEGPVAMVHIRPDGVENPMSMMGTGFVHGWIYCLLLGLLLQKICKKSGYGERVMFVTQVGLAGAFVSRFGDAIWWWQSWNWQIANFAYSVIGAAIAGAILAKFIKSPVTRSDAARSNKSQVSSNKIPE
ncbi:MAG: hypothetical protein HOH58_12415 [Opitutaceae bacterium]|jgi:uncharacterized membrane protein YeaQ/YmgE (transglycosylase-associated protein family)|nr:hypothetical protein [Opitutaceae bacterium]